MSPHLFAAAAVVLAAPWLAACPQGRTAAATQPSPAGFDARHSDPKAIAVVELGLGALGGYRKWDLLRELRFTARHHRGGELTGEFQHAWDRWNGRHVFVATDLATPADQRQRLEVRHELFGDPRARASAGGVALSAEDATARAAEAARQLERDVYLLAFIYKVKDPGVMLAIDDDALVLAPDLPACRPSCTSIKVTFDPAVGGSIWFVDYHNVSRRPEVLETLREGERTRYLLTDWTEAGGLRWPGTVRELGRGGELIEFSAVKVGKPDDARYR